MVVVSGFRHLFSSSLFSLAGLFGRLSLITRMGLPELFGLALVMLRHPLLLCLMALLHFRDPGLILSLNLGFFGAVPSMLDCFGLFSLHLSQLM